MYYIHLTPIILIFQIHFNLMGSREILQMKRIQQYPSWPSGQYQIQPQPQQPPTHLKYVNQEWQTNPNNNYKNLAHPFSMNPLVQTPTEDRFIKKAFLLGYLSSFYLNPIFYDRSPTNNHWFGGGKYRGYGKDGYRNPNGNNYGSVEVKPYKKKKEEPTTTTTTTTMKPYIHIEDETDEYEDCHEVGYYCEYDIEDNKYYKK